MNAFSDWEIFLGCGLIFLFALGSSKLLGRLKFPAVSSYILLGVLMGPFGLRLIPETLVESTDSIGYFVLGMVAFYLGENFLWREFRKVGKEIVVISIAAVLGVLVFVGGGLWLIGQSVAMALILGAAATATDPMATLMVVREYRAKGPFANILLDVVAVDDAWGIIVFVLAIAIAKIACFPGVEHPLAKVLMVAGREIFGALVLGLISGILLSILSRYSKTQTEALIFALSLILVTTGISLRFDFSPLLANMALGVTVINLTRRHLFFDVLRRVDWPFYLLFFVLCGSSLHVPLLKSLTLIGIIYIATRVLGKYAGAYLGARIAHSEESIRRYLGFGLIPQAGVALGLAIVARAEFPSFGEAIFTTIVATTIIFEIFGPFCTKFAITKAGEIMK